MVANTLASRGSIGAKHPPVAKKPNYDFEKRRKELDRKKKKEDKREERLQRKRDGLPEESEEPQEPVTQADGVGEITGGE